MKIERSDYKYICIIIFLLLLIFYFILPFVYTYYNGDIDKTDCLADINSIKCYVDDNSRRVCDYNCTFIDGVSIKKVKYYQP